MPDDIVTRLRAGDPNCTDGHIYDGWANEAADEIENLCEFADRMEKLLDDCRRERNDLRKQLDQATTLAIIYCQEAGRERTWDDATDRVHETLKGWRDA